MPEEVLVVECRIDWPDLGPEDLDLMSEVLDEMPYASADLIERLEDLGMRMARMLETAVARA